MNEFGAAKAILLVEDNPDNREIYSVLLRVSGYRVLEAETGAEGVVEARRHLPDLILMDLSMPVMDGWEALRVLKSHPETAVIPVCALSAHVLLGGDYNRAVEAGFVDYFTKPIEPKEVLRAVQDLIGPPWSEAAAEDRPEPRGNGAT